MKTKHWKALAALGLCAVMTSSVYVALPAIEPMQTMAAEGEEVKVSDLVIKFLAVPEYEPNRYTKSNGGKWAPEELEKGLLIKAEMKLGEGNPEGMMAPLKYSFMDITADVAADQATGDITITYNGLTLKMKAGSTTATLNNGKTEKTLTMQSELAPYFKAVENEQDDKGNQYYACYLPVKFTAEALGANVMWNDAMHRMEMAFAFYYSDAAVEPVTNSKSNYTTKKMESDSNNYNTLKDRITVSDKVTAEDVTKNVKEMVSAAVMVCDPTYQNEDGGWGKTNKDWDLLNETFPQFCPHAYSTIDNGATHGHIKFLTRVIRLSKEYPDLFAGYQAELDTIEKGFWKGMKYVLDAQTESGGWTQYWPYGVGYFGNITFNDNAMPDMMEVVYAMSYDKGLTSSTFCDDFAWARTDAKNQTDNVKAVGLTQENFQTSWDKSLRFTLDAQVVVDGVKTGWAQQYDEDLDKPVPTGGRAFELPSVCTAESATVLRVLCNIENPTDEIKTAIESYYNWTKEIGFTGYKLYNITDRTRELGKDRLVLQDGTQTKMYGRFYGLDITGEYYGLDISKKLTSSKFYEIFSGRDGIANYTQNLGMHERRSGYSYTNTNTESNAKKLYDAWAAALNQ